MAHDVTSEPTRHLGTVEVVKRYLLAHCAYGVVLLHLLEQVYGLLLITSGLLTCSECQATWTSL